MASSSGDHGPASSGDASVHRGGQSAESGTTHRLTSSTQDREKLFRDTLVRLSRAIEALDSLLSSSTTLHNREKIIAMREELFCMIHTIESYNRF